MTALHWATEHNHRDVVELLIKCGADVHAFSKFDKSAFDIALDKNNPETLVMLQVGWGRRKALVILWPTAVSALESEGSCGVWWDQFLFAERTRNTEVDEIWFISGSASACLLGLGGDGVLLPRVLCSRSVSCQVQVAVLSQLWHWCPWGAAERNNLPQKCFGDAKYHSKRDKSVPDPAVFSRKQCRTRSTLIWRERIPSPTPWRSPRRLFSRRGKFSISLVSSLRPTPKQPQVRFYETLSGKALKKVPRTATSRGQAGI